MSMQFSAQVRKCVLFQARTWIHLLFNLRARVLVNREREYLFKNDLKMTFLRIPRHLRER